jgi:uncharacterized protein (DUF1015 family)
MIMAVVVPFRGVLYNNDIIGNLSDVVAPPYDVISPLEQEGFYQQHPNNVIRLILGKPKDGDTGQHDIHSRSAGYFNQWMENKTLIQDPDPAFYLTSVSFEVESQTVTRYGVIGNVRLETFDKGIVLPHERTFSKVKSERLRLMQLCHSNFSPIFGLYADGNGILAQLKKRADIQSPDMDIIDGKGLRHKLWRIIDPETQSHVSSSLEGQAIYIADGHHRYETALNYRQWVKENTPNFDENHPSNFVMMSLSSLNDPGMVIFPAHRLIKETPVDDIEKLLEKAASYFDIRIFTGNDDMNSALKEFDRTMASQSGRNVIGLYTQQKSALFVMVLKEGVMARKYSKEMHEALLDLDVSVLTRLLMMDLLGFDQARLDDATKIGYATTSKAAVTAVQNGEADMAFILNPTKIEQVQRVAQEGLIMPRKSTYFYPKVISGQVFNLLK